MSEDSNMPLEGCNRKHRRVCKPTANILVTWASRETTAVNAFHHRSSRNKQQGDESKLTAKRLVMWFSLQLLLKADAVAVINRARSAS